MSRIVRLLCAALLSLPAAVLPAEEAKPAAAPPPSTRPDDGRGSLGAGKLKALFVTGGPYHDYKTLAPLLTGKIGELASVGWEVRWDLDTLKDEKFADGFDVVVYDICFSEADPAAIANALKAARDGKPAVFIHCAVHSFMKTPAARPDWIDCCGEKSQAHDPYQPFGAEKLDKDHPITKAWPEDWKTPGDELYQTIEFGKRSHALLKVKSPQDGREHIVCWTGEYGKGRVFTTTLGHDLKTAAQPDYHRLLASGILWACGKLGEDGKPAAGYEGGEELPGKSQPPNPKSQ